MRPHPFSDNYSGKPLFAGFRGTAFHVDNAWYQHRAIAMAASHDPSKGVIVNLVDKHRKRRRLQEASCDFYPSEDEKRWPFDSILFNSTFGVAFGGGGPYSWRFYEALSAGAIPVVTDDMLMPWWDGDRYTASHGGESWDVEGWEQCVVFLGEPELFDLAAALTLVASKGLARRRASCAAIVEVGILGAHLAAKDIPKRNGHPTPRSFAIQRYEWNVHVSFWRTFRHRMKQAKKYRKAHLNESSAQAWFSP